MSRTFSYFVILSNSRDLHPGQRHGHGIATIPNQGKFESEYKDGAIVGMATITLPDGGKLEFQFKDGRPYGKGMYISPDGRKRELEFEDGRLKKRVKPAVK